MLLFVAELLEWPSVAPVVQAGWGPEVGALFRPTWLEPEPRQELLQGEGLTPGQVFQGGWTLMGMGWQGWPPEGLVLGW